MTNKGMGHGVSVEHPGNQTVLLIELLYNLRGIVYGLHVDRLPKHTVSHRTLANESTEGPYGIEHSKFGLRNSEFEIRNSTSESTIFINQIGEVLGKRGMIP